MRPTAKHNQKKRGDVKNAKATVAAPAWAGAVARSRAAKLAVLWLASLLVLESFYLKDFLSPDNRTEVFVSELWLFLLINGLVAALAAGIVYGARKPRRLGPKLISVTIFTLFLANYDAHLMQAVPIFKSLLPLLPAPNNDLVLISILYFIFLAVLSLAAGMGVEKLQPKYPRLSNSNINAGMLILILIIFLGQAIPAITPLTAIARQSSVVATLPAGQTPAKTTDKPDIFYFVLDRYTSQQVLQDQFQFDNSPFVDSLRAAGFTVKDNAQSNYPYTAMSVSSTLAAQYTNQYVAPYANDQLQSRTLYHNLVYQSPVVKALKGAGYQYYTVGSWYGTSNKAPLADHDYLWDMLLSVFGKQVRLRGFERIAYTRSVFYRLGMAAGIPFWPLHMQEHDQIADVRTQIDVLGDITTKEKPGGRFVFSHILVPHEPFYFNGDGSLAANPEITSVDKTNKEKYVGQVQFINSQMQTIIANIKKQSGGKAVIIISADEGAHPDDIYTDGLHPYSPAGGEDGNIAGDMRDWPQNWLQMKYGITQAADIPRATPDDLSHLASVNLFRIVLNRYAGASLDYLPDCQFGLTNGSDMQFQYASISRQLSGVDHPECGQFATHK
jgi:hypothetical protein